MEKESGFRSTLRALGLVFGDIGTSPIYTMTVIFLLLPRVQENVLGVVSLIIWTLIIVVYIQYVMLAMRLDHFGEGGILILRQIAVKTIKNTSFAKVISVLGFLGASFLLGDGVITPSISILSAVEGIKLVPAFAATPVYMIVAVSVFIAFLLFLIQSMGSDRIAGAFGPVMFLWFLALGASGIRSIMEYPAILNALNPIYAIKFCISQGLATFLIVSQIILCATGAEALYADMGHIGKKPIMKAWNIAFIALALSYLGQGAYLFHEAGSTVLLFGMVHHESLLIYIPFLILSIVATVIASQSLISGAFSLAYQAIVMRIIPLLRVRFTSSHLKSQIYIGVVNWALMFMVMLMMVTFRKSENLAAAYGLSVTGTMAITVFTMGAIFFHRHNWLLGVICIPLFVINLMFFGSCLTKFPYGGYWSLIIAAIPLVLMIIWVTGERKLRKFKRTVPLDKFLPHFESLYKKSPRVPGTAIFTLPDYRHIPPYIEILMSDQGIIYEDNVLASVIITEEPHGFRVTKPRVLAEGLRQFEIHLGYMDAGRDLTPAIEETRINPRVLYYAIDRVQTTKLRWLPYKLLVRLSPSFLSFLKQSASNRMIHGVAYRVDFV